MTSRTIQFVSSVGAAWPWQRQTPNGSSVWGSSAFLIDKPADTPPDWLVVYDGFSSDYLQTCVPIERRIFITGEPESFYRYQKNFMNQFGYVLTSQRGIRHENIIQTQTGISWFVGVNFENLDGLNTYNAVLNFEDFQKINPNKTKLCSIICSNKVITKGHRQRLAFVNSLKEALGDMVDVYGRGFREVKDKDEALANYRYHIALENSSHFDYWTEKLSDPYLRGCFPIYFGCKNIANYFSKDSLAVIDINNQEKAIIEIKKILISDIDVKNSNQLSEAKKMVLCDYNIFSMLDSLCSKVEYKNGKPSSLIEADILKSDAEIKNQSFGRKVKRFFKNL